MSFVQGLLCGLAFGELQTVFQGTRDHWREPLEPAFHHIVRGTRFDAFDRALLAERPGNENERDFQAAFLEYAEGAQAVETRKVVIGKDELEVSPIQRCFEFLFGLDLPPFAIVPGCPQLLHFELGVQGVVVENQQFERRGHASPVWGSSAARPPGADRENFDHRVSRIPKPGRTGSIRKAGGVEEDRTPDLRIANATLSQLSYNPTCRQF